MRGFLAGIRPGPTLISCFVVLGFFGVLSLLIVHPMTVASDVADILKIMVGTLGAKFGDVVQYHFGSSAGSKAKDDVLHAIASGNAAGGGSGAP